MTDARARYTQPIRVLAFCDNYAEPTKGGSERVAREVYTRIARAGIPVSVIASLPRSQHRSGPDSGVDVVGARSWDLSTITRMQSSVCPMALTTPGNLVKRLSNTAAPTVLHANSLHFQTTIAATRLAGLLTVPLVTTVHVGSITHLNAPVRALTNAYEQIIGRWILRRSDRIIAVSDDVASHVTSLGVEQDRVDIVPNGVDHSRFHPPVVRGERPFVHVGFVGRLINNKAPGVLIRALKHLVDLDVPVRATFAGDGPDRRGLERLAGKLELHGVVTFIGHTTGVAELLRDLDVLVRPSKTEGMSLAILEAMASGVCVVASDIPANRVLIIDGTTGLLFREGDEMHLTSVLLDAIEDPARRTTIAAAGHRASLGHDWDRCAAATLAVLKTASQSAP